MATFMCSQTILAVSCSRGTDSTCMRWLLAWKRAERRRNNGVEMIANDPHRSCLCFRRERPTDRVGGRGWLIKPHRADECINLCTSVHSSRSKLHFKPFRPASLPRHFQTKPSIIGAVHLQSKLFEYPVKTKQNSKPKVPCSIRILVLVAHVSSPALCGWFGILSLHWPPILIWIHRLLNCN